MKVGFYTECTMEVCARPSFEHKTLEGWAPGSIGFPPFAKSAKNGAPSMLRDRQNEPPAHLVVPTKSETPNSTYRPIVDFPSGE
jgi:hypothetical protein